MWPPPNKLHLPQCLPWHSCAFTLGATQVHHSCQVYLKSKSNLDPEANKLQSSKPKSAACTDKFGEQIKGFFFVFFFFPKVTTIMSLTMLNLKCLFNR